MGAGAGAGAAVGVSPSRARPGTLTHYFTPICSRRRIPRGANTGQQERHGLRFTKKKCARCHLSNLHAASSATGLLNFSLTAVHLSAGALAGLLARGGTPDREVGWAQAVVHGKKLFVSLICFAVYMSLSLSVSSSVFLFECLSLSLSPSLSLSLIKAAGPLPLGLPLPARESKYV